MSLLAFTSGFVDTLSFIALFGLFAAHITGNFVLLTASVADYRYGLRIKLLGVPTFIARRVLTRFYIIRRERHVRDAAAHVLFGQAVLLAVFMARRWSTVRRSSARTVGGSSRPACWPLPHGDPEHRRAHLPERPAADHRHDRQPDPGIVDIVDIAHGHGHRRAKRARLAKLGPMLFWPSSSARCWAPLGYLTIGFLALVTPIAVATGFGVARPAASAA